MDKKTVLVSGASIAGPTLAYWLHRFGFEVTVVERAESLRLGGQNIDVKGAAQRIARMMGIEDEIRRANTGETGVRFVDEHNNTKAELPKGETDIGTSELEILRGDLAEILYAHTRHNVEYIFGDQISALTQQQAGAEVTFKSGITRSFDLVVAADGIRSRTRQLMFGDEPLVKPVGLYTAYMTIPRQQTDTTWARWHNATGSRVAFIRPDSHGTTRVSFSFLSKPMGYESMPVNEQKEVLKQKFADVGWEVPRILRELDASSDMYFDAISQVMAPRWSNGRFAMVGDAAYCPSPLTGMGTSLSIVGAYILAGELGRHQDYSQAFAAYENLMRPYVKGIQKLPPGVPDIAHPKTKLGIAVFNFFLSVISSKPVTKLAALFSGKKKDPTDDTINLPEYK